MTKRSNQAHDLSSYRFRGQEKVLFDTNIWCYLYPAPSRPGKYLARIYSNALREMLRNKVRLILDALVFSEYLNRYCRIEWNALYKGTYSNFKDFRKSPQFPSVGNRAVTHARAILRLTERGSQSFEAFDLEHVLNEFEWGEADAVDGLLIENCRCNGWKLVTHDADFTWGGIEILTLNNKLVEACG